MKVGIVGIGKMGELHLKKYLTFPDVEMVGIYDTDPEKLKRVSLQYGVTAFPDLPSLLFEAEAVSVASPTCAHYAVSKLAIEAGVHLLVEKPLTDSAKFAEDLVNRARRQRTVLQVGLIERFRYRTLLEEIVHHQVQYIEASRLNSQLARDRSVDLIADLMIHDLDLTLSILNEIPISVAAIGVPVVTDRFDMANARLEFPSGAVATLNASHAALEPLRKFKIYFSNTYASLDFISNSVKMCVRDMNGKVKLVEKNSIAADPLRDQLRHFVDCVKEGRTPLVSGEDGLRALRLAEEISGKILSRDTSTHPASIQREPIHDS